MRAKRFLVPSRKVRSESRSPKWRVGALVIFIALAVFVKTGLAQFELPDFVKEALKSNRAFDPDRQLMVTNADFKKFRPQMSFEAKEADSPALMTQREAADYATFAGKRLGKDLLWQPPPPGEHAEEKAAGYGYLMILAPGTQIDASLVGNPLPTPPPGMVYVPEGPFIMGSNVGDPDEAPQHTATAGPFFIDKYEVSNADYKIVVPDFTVEPGRENFPAVVTWEQAAAYAEKAGKRLPTEAEWEKAARGTDGRTFPWGESYDPTFVNWDEKVPRGGSPARPESPYGCIDMAGGVWEWTADWYKPYPENDTPCEQFGEMYRVIRGGATFNDVAMTRTTHRYYLPPNTTGHLPVGFRCVKDLK